MIEIIEGSIGGGKSYLATYLIGKQLAEGGVVFTNVDVVWDPTTDPDGKHYSGIRKYIESEYRVRPVPEQLHIMSKEFIANFDEHISYGTDEMDVLCVLDETQLTWSSAEDHRKFDKRLFAWLTQSRKCDVNLVLITQDKKNIAVHFRRLALFVYQCKDSETWELPGWGVVTKGYFFIGKFAKTGELMKRMYWKKDKRIFGSYRTKALLGGFEATRERVGPVKLEKIPVEIPEAFKWEAIRPYLVGVCVGCVLLGRYFIAIKTGY